MGFDHTGHGMLTPVQAEMLTAIRDRGPGGLADLQFVRGIGSGKTLGCALVARQALETPGERVAVLDPSAELMHALRSLLGHETRCTGWAKLGWRKLRHESEVFVIDQLTKSDELEGFDISGLIVDDMFLGSRQRWRRVVARLRRVVGGRAPWLLRTLRAAYVDPGESQHMPAEWLARMTKIYPARPAPAQQHWPAWGVVMDEMQQMPSDLPGSPAQKVDP